MAKESKISWCDATMNFWIGCTKVSPGCRSCYAKTLAERYGWVKWGKGEPRYRTSKTYWRQPLNWNRHCEKNGTTRRVFTNSLADWLDPEVSIEWFVEMLDIIRRTPRLSWLLLTKRPELFNRRMSDARDYLKAGVATDQISWMASWADHVMAPPNVWIGASAENQEWLDRRMPDLYEIPAGVHFISAEPLLGPLELDRWILDPIIPLIDFVIVGGESGPDARPMDPAWARSIRDQCKVSGVAFWMKQMSGKTRPLPEVPLDLRIQQFPK